MLLGNTDRFGIEFDLDDYLGEARKLIRFSYWLCGQRVGDYEKSNSLSEVLYLWDRIAWDAGSRVNENLMRLEKKELANLLASGMYGGYPENEAIENRAIEEQWARHVIDPDVDVFDGWHIFLVEQGDLARCVYHNYQTASYYECRLRYGEFDEVLSTTLQSLRQYYEPERQ